MEKDKTKWRKGVDWKVDLTHWMRISAFTPDAPSQASAQNAGYLAGLNVWDHRYNLHAFKTVNGWAEYQRVEYIKHECTDHPYVTCSFDRERPVKQSHF